MKAGYLGPFYSADQAYKKGLGILSDLTKQDRGMMKYSDEEREMIELVTSTESSPIPCRHEGFCVTEKIGFVDVLDLGGVGNVVLTDGISKKKKCLVDLTEGKDRSTKAEHRYVANFNPMAESQKPLLRNIKEPSVLILRGCDQLLVHGDFPFDKFKTIKALEISGCSTLTTIPEQVISEMTQLHYLNLSHLPIQQLSDDFFSSKLTQLRCLILRGCPNLSSLPKPFNMPLLQCLDLSHLPIHWIDDECFAQLVELRWLILRWCSNIMYIPIEGMKKLKFLDVSHCIALKIIECPNPHLQVIDMSYTTMSGLPSKIYDTNLTHLIVRDAKLQVLNYLEYTTTLQVLDVSGARNMIQVDQIKSHTNLVVLDLSRTAIFSAVRLQNLVHLRRLILKECTNLIRLPLMENLTDLEVLDVSGCGNLKELPKGLSNLTKLTELNLSGCSCLKELREGLFDHMPCLLQLDLSQTTFNHLPSFANLANLRKLSLRCLELESLESLASLPNLVEVLDLGGFNRSSLQDLRLDFLESLVNLQILNLSDTSVEKVLGMSKLVNLKQLLLGNCQKLKVLSDLQTLTNLETLDLSLPNDCPISSETEAEAQRIQLLSAPSNLRRLVLANRPGVLQSLPLASLDNLEYLDISGTHEIDFIRLHLRRMENLQEIVGWDINIHSGQSRGRILKPDELHVVSTFYHSGFDRFRNECTKLNDLISSIQQKFNLAVASTMSNDGHDAPTNTDTTTCTNIQSQALKAHLGSMHIDLNYILESIDLLKGSRDCKSSEELLHELMDAATRLSVEDFTFDSTNLILLVRTVVKLKLLVPPKQVNDLEALEITQKGNKLQFTRTKNKEIVITDSVEDPQGTAVLLSSYKSLNSIQQQCLLCFSVFSCSKGRHESSGVANIKSLVIKNRMLIHWWVGEGFFDPQYEENGKEILKALEDKGFITLVMNKGQESGSCCMQSSVHTFVTEQAKEENFCNFDNGKLTPYFNASKRACLLKSQNNFLSSCKLWGNYTSSSEELKNFNNIHALLNVNEPMIDIREEWFSKMKALYVLHLGSWGFEDDKYIEVVNQKFLKHLKSMKQLRLLSLQGFLTIKKLPDSVCNLTNLRILNLRDCGYLEELPTDIGSLKHLTHLDLTHCTLLYKLPKAIRLLSKLEVLKGFVITYHGGGRQHGDACTLGDLLKLEKLKKLSLIVNIDEFPDNEDLQVFKGMKKLCNLKITWEQNYNTDPEQQAVIVPESLRPSSWQNLKCWERQAGHNNIEDTTRSNHLNNLKKLVLFCFPSETAPNWLDPRGLENLEKLYIVGGRLANLRGTNQNTWKVKILRLKYLRNLKMLWTVLRDTFPNMTYLESHECDKLTRFPCDDDGVWTIASE